MDNKTKTVSEREAQQAIRDMKVGDRIVVIPDNTGRKRPDPPRLIRKVAGTD